MSKVHPRDAKFRWQKHLFSCYRRGYEDALAGRNDQPYKIGQGVQRQRRGAWRRGYNRAIEGKPLDDING